MFSYLSYLSSSSPLSNFRSFSSLHKAKRNPVSIRSHYLLPATSSLPSVLNGFPVLDISCEWNHALRGLL